MANQDVLGTAAPDLRMSLYVENYFLTSLVKRSKTSQGFESRDYILESSLVPSIRQTPTLNHPVRKPMLMATMSSQIIAMIRIG